jgi:hypothetical protein
MADPDKPAHGCAMHWQIWSEALLFAAYFDAAH